MSYRNLRYSLYEEKKTRQVQTKNVMKKSTCNAFSDKQIMQCNDLEIKIRYEKVGSQLTANTSGDSQLRLCDHPSFAQCVHSKLVSADSQKSSRALPQLSLHTDTLNTVQHQSSTRREILKDNSRAVNSA